MKIIVAGSRSFSSYDRLAKIMDKVTANLQEITIISGAARGADTLGERWAAERKHTVIRKPADWDRFGKSAGYRRNEEMAAIADALVAFWDGKSPGTKHMIDLMTSTKKPVRIIRF
jgi:hypothetical protein